MKKGEYHHSVETKKKMAEARIGRHLSEEHKRKLSKIFTGKNSPNYGRKHSEEIRNKMSKAQKGKNLSEETKKKMSEARKGDKNHNWKGGGITIYCKVCGKEKYYSLSCIKRDNCKFCSNRCAGIWNFKHSNKKDTSIEIAIEKELIKRNIPYSKQVPIIGIALVDFLIPNRLIIQCDGDFFHNLPGRKDRDFNQDYELYFNGYVVFRFTETEIKKSAEKCINKIINKIGETNAKHKRHEGFKIPQKR